MSTEWQRVTTLQPLELDELQIWRIDLSEGGSTEDIYKKHLSPPELTRASRLRAGQVRMQFLVARAALRVLLGNLLGISPYQVPIVLGAYGKPETPPVNGNSIFFNCAHSRDTVLIGLSRICEIGVDIEYLDRKADELEVARNSFTPNEFRAIESCVDLTERQQAFFRGWTRKEAVVKADGRGLSIPLTALEVPVLEPARSAPVLVLAESAPRTWFVSDIALDNELAGAFAIGVPDKTPRTFAFTLDLLSSDSLGA